MIGETGWRFSCAALFVAVSAAILPRSSGQAPAAAEVSVVCTVSDRSGRFVVGLTEQDFEILDDQRPQKIERVAFVDGIPLSIAVLVDASASSSFYLSSVQEAVISFVKETLLPRRYSFKIIGFSAAGPPVAYAGGDLEQLARVVRAFKPAGRTPLRDIVGLVCRQLLEDKQPPGSRRIVLVLSDGDDNLSETTLKQGVEVAQRAGIVISTISTGFFARSRWQGGAEDLQRGVLALRYLSEETGGAALVASDLKSLKECFRNVSEELENQYVLSYKPKPPPGDARFRQIRVSVMGKNVSVRAAKGYYPPP